MIEGMKYVLQERTNAQMLEDIFQMFIPKGSVVYDITYGTGQFWKWNTSDYVIKGFDKNNNHECMQIEWSKIPELNLPKCDVLVFDPPMVERPQKTNSAVIQNFRDDKKPIELLKDAKPLLIDLTKEWLIVKMIDSIYAGKNNWYHFEVYNMLTSHFDLEDFVIRPNPNCLVSPKMLKQKHFRKNLSYFFIFRKKKELINN